MKGVRLFLIKRLFVIISILCCYFLLIACANVTVTPPVLINDDLTKNQSFNASYDTVWHTIMDWFIDHDIIIGTIDKFSGLINARHTLSVTDTYLDCGEIKATGTLGNDRLIRAGLLNITVRERGENIVVTVSFSGEFLFLAQDSWDGRGVRREGKCISTGSIEESVFDYIKKNTGVD